MFNPYNLIYCGKKQGIDVFYYNGVRIDVTLSGMRDGWYLYIGFSNGNGISGMEMAGLLQWFGIDRSQFYDEHEFPDKSFYYVQRRAA